MRLRDRHTDFQEWLDRHEVIKVLFMVFGVVVPGLLLIESKIFELVALGIGWMIAWCVLRWAYVEGHWR